VNLEFADGIVNSELNADSIDSEQVSETSPPDFKERKDKYSTEQVIAVCGIGGVILLIIGSMAVNIVTELLEYEGGPEFGYRLDVNPELYEDLGANRHPYVSDAGYPDFSTTVYVEGSSKTNSSEYWSGSGVIISHHWVLTAAHVVENLNLDDTYVVIGSDFQISESLYQAEMIHIHPAWRGHEEDLIYGADIALIELVEPIQGISPSPWADILGIENSEIGNQVFSSGFGSYDYSDSDCDSGCLVDEDGYYSQRRAWENTLDRLIGAISPPHDYDRKDEWKGGLIAYDFDSPSGEHNSLGKDGFGFNLNQGDISYAGDGESARFPRTLEGTGVPGDSGGPTYAMIGGEWTVIGITSHGSETSDYGDVAFSTRVSSHANWICSFSFSEKPIIGC